MQCSKAQHWISRRIDGVLDERCEAALAEHLSRCTACKAYAETLFRIGLDRIDAPEPSPDFTARVARHLQESPDQRRPVLRRPVVFRPIAAGLGIAAALGGFTIGSFLHLTNGGGTPSPNGVIELAVGETVDPLAEDTIESVLIAMFSSAEE